MKKLILASVSAIALFGVAACSDTDGTTTQSVPDATTTEPATPPASDAAPSDTMEETAPADPAAPSGGTAPAE